MVSYAMKGSTRACKCVCRCFMVHLPSVMLAALLLVLLVMVLLQFCIITSNTMFPTCTETFMQVKISYNPSLSIDRIKRRSELLRNAELSLQLNGRLTLTMDDSDKLQHDRSRVKRPHISNHLNVDQRLQEPARERKSNLDELNLLLNDRRNDKFHGDYDYSKKDVPRNATLDLLQQNGNEMHPVYEEMETPYFRYQEESNGKEAGNSEKIPETSKNAAREKESMPPTADGGEVDTKNVNDVIDPTLPMPGVNYYDHAAAQLIPILAPTLTRNPLVSNFALSEFLDKRERILSNVMAGGHKLRTIKVRKYVDPTNGLVHTPDHSKYDKVIGIHQMQMQVEPAGFTVTEQPSPMKLTDHNENVTEIELDRSDKIKQRNGKDTEGVSTIDEMNSIRTLHEDSSDKDSNNGPIIQAAKVYDTQKKLYSDKIEKRKHFDTSDTQGVASIETDRARTLHEDSTDKDKNVNDGPTLQGAKTLFDQERVPQDLQKEDFISPLPEPVSHSEPTETQLQIQSPWDVKLTLLKRTTNKNAVLPDGYPVFFSPYPPPVVNGHVCRDGLCSEFLKPVDYYAYKTCLSRQRGIAAYVEATPGPCHFMDGSNRAPVALASFPGSGNTWVRGLLEKATGVCTGAVYCDKSIRASGMNGEYVRSGVVIAVKTHRSVKVAWTEKDKPVTPTTLYQAKVPVYGAAILLVRNPYRALIAEWHRVSVKTLRVDNGHLSTKGEEKFGDNAGWKSFIKRKLPQWQAHFEEWVVEGRRNNKSVLVVRYEDLKSDTVNEVKRMLEFLGFGYKDDELRQRLSTNFSTFHRKQTGDFLHFTREQRRFIDKGLAYTIDFLQQHNSGETFGMEDYLGTVA